MKKGKLHLIPVPIAENAAHTVPSYVKKVAFSCTYFLAERAKTCRRMLRAIGFEGSFDTLEIVELDKHMEESNFTSFLKHAEKGEDIVLMSEAGCPAIADPGALIVREAHARQIQVVPYVGPSSILLALMGSGMDGQRFCFNGYLNYKKGQLQKELLQLESISYRRKETQLFIEAPYRNKGLIEVALGCLKNSTQFAIAVDLTSDNELIISKSIGDWKKNDIPEVHKRPAIFLILAV